MCEFSKCKSARFEAHYDFDTPFQLLGVHLADGTQYTYLTGNEYEDIAASWDWNMIPGTTTDYGATPLNCGNVQRTGLEDFVGGASDGNVGIAAMRYTNPITGAFKFQKVWFYLENDLQHIMVSNVSSTSAAPVRSVLDQRRQSGGPIYVDGVDTRAVLYNASARHTTLWHGSVGYVINSSSAATLSVEVASKSGNWSSIGSSPQPPTTVPLFAAYLTHHSTASPIAYTVFPGLTFNHFKQRTSGLALTTVQNDANVSAVFDQDHDTAMVVFWKSEGGTVEFPSSRRRAAFSIAVNGNAAIIYKAHLDELTVSDPSQKLQTIRVTVARRNKVILIIPLPQGGLAGSSVTRRI